MKHNIKYGVVAALTLAAFVAPMSAFAAPKANDTTSVAPCVIAFSDEDGKVVDSTKSYYNYNETTANGNTFKGKKSTSASGDVVTVDGANTTISVDTFNNIVKDLNAACLKRYEQVAKVTNLTADIAAFDTKINDNVIPTETITFNYNDGTAKTITVTKDTKLTNKALTDAYDVLVEQLKDLAKQKDIIYTGVDADADKKAAIENLDNGEKILNLIKSAATAAKSEVKSMNAELKTATEIKKKDENTKIITYAIEDANVAILKADVTAKQKEADEARAKVADIAAKIDAAEAKTASTAKAATEAANALAEFKTANGIVAGDLETSGELKDTAAKRFSASVVNKYNELVQANKDAAKAKTDAKTAETDLKASKAATSADYTAYTTAKTAVDTAKTAYDNYVKTVDQDKNKTTIEAILGEDETKTVSLGSVSGVSRAYTYTGKAITPAVVVKNSEGITLTAGTDYTVTYNNNIKVGTATITISGKGEYTGTVTKSFYIDPAKSSIKKVAVAAKKMTVTVKKGTAASGVQIAYRVKGTNKWSYVKTTGTSKTISSLKKGKKYQVVVRSYTTKSGKVTNYSGWSATKTTAKIK